MCLEVGMDLSCVYVSSDIYSYVILVLVVHESHKDIQVETYAAGNSALGIHGSEVDISGDLHSCHPNVDGFKVDTGVVTYTSTTP